MSDKTNSQNTKKLNVFDTELHADCIEWCPVEGHQNILVCGTYELEENSSETLEDGSKTQKRRGLLHSFLFNAEDHDDGGMNFSLNQKHKISCDGILDCKWAHSLLLDQCVLGVVNSVGVLQLHSFDFDSIDKESHSVVNKCTINGNALALSLDWSTGKYTDNSPEIAISDSTGGITIVKADTMKVADKFQAHFLEAWVTAFNYWDSNIIYTGGDDSKLCSWDRRCDNECTIITGTRHESGVTSIQSNAYKEHIFASGSYDECIFIWDERNLHHPVSETKVNGGVWRIKWDPKNGNNILAACMDNGFQILDCTNFCLEGQDIVASYMDHKSLAYGVDWSRISIKDCAEKLNCAEDNNNENLEDSTIEDALIDNDCLDYPIISSCSFYDNSMHSWLWMGGN